MSQIILITCLRFSKALLSLILASTRVAHPNHLALHARGVLALAFIGIVFTARELLSLNEVPHTYVHGGRALVCVVHGGSQS